MKSCSIENTIWTRLEVKVWNCVYVCVCVMARGGSLCVIPTATILTLPFPGRLLRRELGLTVVRMSWLPLAAEEGWMGEGGGARMTCGPPNIIPATEP